jgi:hypothetical protein
MAETVYYLGWLDKRTDPFPQHESIPENATGRISLGGRSARLLAPDHPDWPGIPFLEEEGETVHDSRMGIYRWPGLPYLDEDRKGLLYLGPTISALFHPASRFCDLKDLEGVFLLYPGGSDVSVERMEHLCQQLCQARARRKRAPGRATAGNRIHFVPIAGLSDPTDHTAIMHGIEDWLRTAPFGTNGRSSRREVRIVVNLSTGTPSMHACWLMLRWNGQLLKGVNGTVEFVQGDGGMDGSPERSPLRNVLVDTLARFGGNNGPVPPVQIEADRSGVSLETLGPPYDSLRQKLDQAALLGLPVLLQGERGTGKTFLARYYHQRRAARRPAPPGNLKRRPEKNVAPGVWLPRQMGNNAFVTVTLSEFADLDNLRDTLFGWAERSWNLAYEAYDGLLGEAHGGTLFLDEIHHLDRSLQASLLGPLNNRRYRPKMAVYEIATSFDLVVATNDPEWRTRLADDFRDRIERIVLEVPSFRSFQRSGSEVLWTFWDWTIKQRCRECAIEYTEDGDFQECVRELRTLLRRHPLQGNWRDLQRLADNLLLGLASGRDGQPPALRWSREQLELAVSETFGNS